MTDGEKIEGHHTFRYPWHVWKKIKPEHQKLVREISAKHIAKANELAKKDNADAISQLKELGVQFVEFNKDDLAKAETIRKTVISKLEKKILSTKIIEEVNKTR